MFLAFGNGSTTKIWSLYKLNRMRFTTTAQNEAGKRRRAYEFCHRCLHEHAKHIPLIRRATSFCDLAAVMVPSVAGDLHDASPDESPFRQLSFERSGCNVLL